MRTSPSYAAPLLFGPPGRPTVLVVRTVLFTAVAAMVATAAATTAGSTEVALLLVGAAVLLLLAWTKIAVRRAHGCEERLACADDRDGNVDGRVRALADRFQALLLEYEEQQRLAAERRAELDGTVRERTAALMVANRRLERVDQIKDEFVSLLAHELRTPLTSIRTYVDLLLRYDEQGVDGSERREFLEIVRTQTQRVARLVLEILDVSRLRAGRFELTVGDHDAVAAVEEAVETFAEVTGDRPPRLVLHRPDDPPSVRCDHARLLQIVTTLVENAVRHGGASSPIDIEWECDGDRVTVSVSDRGAGVPPGDREAIFEPFFATRRDGHSSESGTGLGLYLGRELARRMDGDLWVEDHDDGGARFVLSLPTAASAVREIPDAAPSPATV